MTCQGVKTETIAKTSLYLKYKDPQIDAILTVRGFFNLTTY